ncbi:dynamin family protein [Fictibacillus iocasae]|uniref:Dynamin family protein n=1 Tax=Fictibacillus iocasae TaxID=2715437 RepID=A0ABW2NJ65_9BACL
MTQKKQLTQNKLIASLEAFYHFFQKAGDKDRLEKVQNYYRKAEYGDLSVVFCGHFSAGKSSLLNALSADGTLPVSPVPTSANVVVLRKGTSRAIVTLYNGQYAEFVPPFDIKDIKRLCKNGELVKEIEIFTPDFGLEGIALYDTPGIDSTDDLHYKAADAVSDAADIIFYVMDYNHVLSETNFHFIEKLTRKGVPVKLIINQMDKHEESELSLKEFKKKAEDYFSKYRITPEDIFYTSVRSPSWPGNGLNALRAYIEKSSIEKERILENEWDRRLHWLANDYAEEHKPHGCSLDEIENAFQEREERKDSLDRARKAPEEEKKKWRAKFQSILNDAILMPYETRELAGSVLESLQPKFKVGFFMSRDKTEKERENRLNAFAASLNRNVETQIVWHLKRVMDEFNKAYESDGSIDVSSVPHKLLVSGVKPGMDADGKALLHFCDYVSGEVRSMIRQDLHSVLSIMDKAIDLALSRIIDTCRRQLEVQEDILKTLQESENTQKMWEEETERLLNIASRNILVDTTAQGLLAQASGTEMEVSELLLQAPIMAKKAKKEDRKTLKVSTSLNGEMNRLAENIKVLSALPAFEEDAKDAEGLIKRIKNRSYTFALFGAFSSGKSSFANALIGEKLLPTSPNPMTAAIYEIKKPDPSHPHGTAEIACKSEEELVDELNGQVLDMMNETLEDSVQWAKENGIENHRFMHPFLEGYSVMKEKIGQSFIVNMDEIEKYGAFEPYACYVNKITVYYSCELTERGIVLVDTPGADSINSRHTDVAFQYIKNSDIILYVTYYNHAFSAADKEFLIQLGRVKDVFLADKMFFVLNACDLAQDEEEVEVVMSHIKDNLLSFGVRHPRLYPVSSHAELGGNKNKTGSGFPVLRQDMEYFLETELASVMAAQCESKNMFLKEKLHSVVHDLQKSQGDQAERTQKLLADAEEMKQKAIRRLSIPKEKLFLEITELFHYVKQRVNVRTHDFFKECYHPGMMNSGKNSSDALTEAAVELWNKIEYDLNQEMKATSLRIEKWISVYVADAEQAFRQTENHSVKLDKLDVSQFIFLTPVLSHKLEVPSEKEIKKWNKHYKNPRQFFEGDGRDGMKEELLNCQSVHLAKWTEDTITQLKNHYSAECEQKNKESVEHFHTQISRAVATLLNALDNPEQAAEYEAALLKWN